MLTHDILYHLTMISICDFCEILFKLSSNIAQYGVAFTSLIRRFWRKGDRPKQSKYPYFVRPRAISLAIFESGKILTDCFASTSDALADTCVRNVVIRNTSSDLKTLWLMLPNPIEALRVCCWLDVLATDWLDVLETDWLVFVLDMRESRVDVDFIAPTFATCFLLWNDKNVSLAIKEWITIHYSEVDVHLNVTQCVTVLHYLYWKWPCSKYTLPSAYYHQAWATDNLSPRVLSICTCLSPYVGSNRKCKKVIKYYKYL